MQIKVTGKNLDVGDALREHIETRLNLLQQKYFDGTVHAHVTVEKQRGGFNTDCALHLATGLVLQAEGKGAEAHPSFDEAAAHLEKQLRRYKQRLKDRHNGHHAAAAIEVPSYVIAAPDEDEEAPAEFHPVVIAETKKTMATLSVSQAVEELDFSGAPVVVFRHAGTSRVNVVYRRADGNIGWVDLPAEPA